MEDVNEVRLDRLSFDNDQAEEEVDAVVDIKIINNNFHDQDDKDGGE